MGKLIQVQRQQHRKHLREELAAVVIPRPREVLGAQVLAEIDEVLAES